MADQQQVEQQTLPEDQQPAGPTAEELQAQIAEERRKREAAERQFQFFKNQAEQLQRQQAQQFQQQYQYQPDYQAETQTHTRPQKSQREIMREIRDATTAYKVNNPDWQEYDKDMNSLISDQTRLLQVAAYDDTGDVDWDKTIWNARREVELEKWRATKQKASEVEQRAESTKAELRRAATVTGNAGQPPPQTIDPTDPRNPDGSPMTSDEMLRSGLVEQDPRDPIRPIRRK